MCPAGGRSPEVPCPSTRARGRGVFPPGSAPTFCSAGTHRRNRTARHVRGWRAHGYAGRPPRKRLPLARSGARQQPTEPQPGGGRRPTSAAPGRRAPHALGLLVAPHDHPQVPVPSAGQSAVCRGGPPGTTVTGQGAWLTSRLATDPVRRCRKSPQPQADLRDGPVSEHLGRVPRLQLRPHPSGADCPSRTGSVTRTRMPNPRAICRTRDPMLPRPSRPSVRPAARSRSVLPCSPTRNRCGSVRQRSGSCVRERG